MRKQEPNPKVEPATGVVRYGHPALRRKAAAVRKVTPEVLALADSMIETMGKTNGVGLAANQVGVSERVIVLDVGDGPVVLINPQIVKSKGTEKRVEGCLSLPGLYGEVPRPTHVMVKGLDRTGKVIRIEAEGLLAQALSHELDHLNGMLFIDRVDPDTLHWAVGEPNEAGEVPHVPTTKEEALRVFSSRPTEG